MGSTTDKIKGYTNEAVGKAKQSIGKAVGDDKMRAEGMAQEVMAIRKRQSVRRRARSRTLPPKSPTRHTTSSNYAPSQSKSATYPTTWSPIMKQLTPAVLDSRHR